MMNTVIFLIEYTQKLPRAMILTISLSVLLVLLLAGFVLYMWKMQEKEGVNAIEINNLTNAIGAGVINFLVDGDGFITHASDGFFRLIGFTREEYREVFQNNFYPLLEDKYREFFKMIDFNKDTKVNEEMEIKTGEGVKWILISGNTVMRKREFLSISAVILDITENKKLASKLAFEQERYKRAMELSNDVIMNYDIYNDTLTISNNFRQYYGGETYVVGFYKNARWKNGAFYKDDIKKVGEIVSSMVQKDSRFKADDTSEVQLRVRNSEGNYVWCRFIYLPIKDNRGEIKEFIGKLINIDAEKNSLLKAEKKAMIDPLTKAFNKEFTRVKIQEYIDNNPDKKGMLLLVDIDKFKSINDNYGHLMGDNIIIEVVTQVSKAFRSNDIVGRIGGDEFVVFVCNVNNPEDQIKQAQKLHAVLRQPATFDGVTIQKSASIGIAIYPDHAMTYEGLIECADKALYRVKGSGRDAFIIYDKKDFDE
ncbi:MAG: sensor domain-containing diguanylate cyclase [Lachnospiraceae bacterium]|nr:sensor domain-containing diguanylate cyclase [Lachnospiraceae bacterium]